MYLSNVKTTKDSGWPIIHMYSNFHVLFNPLVLYLHQIQTNYVETNKKIGKALNEQIRKHARRVDMYIKLLQQQHSFGNATLPAGQNTRHSGQTGDD